MAVEDGKVMEFTPEMLKEFAKLRHASFTAMMNQCAEDGWEIVPLREEGGFTARLAVKQPHDTPRGMLIICAGGAYRWLSPREKDPVALAFSAMGYQSFLIEYSVMEQAGGLRPLREVAEAVRTMSRSQVRRLPVTEGGRLVGMVTLCDLARREDCRMECAQAMEAVSANLTRR